MLRFLSLVVMIIVIGPIIALFLGGLVCARATCSPILEGLAITAVYIAISYAALMIYRRLGRTAAR